MSQLLLHLPGTDAQPLGFDIYKTDGYADRYALARCFLSAAGPNAPAISHMPANATNEQRLAEIRRQLRVLAQDGRYTFFKVVRRANPADCVGMEVFGWKDGSMKTDDLFKDEMGYSFLEMLTGDDRKPHWHQERMGVTPAFRGDAHGHIARRLLERALRHMMARHKARVFTTPRNEAIGFFGHFGFQSIPGQMPNFLIRPRPQQGSSW